MMGTTDAQDLKILVEGGPHFRKAILNRPSVLNALNIHMAGNLLKLYQSWEDNPDIGFAILKGSGNAFCAGGDVVNLYHLLNTGNTERCKGFFGTLYNFIYLLGTFLKPQVAILNGITMGGGAGVSIPGTFRIATNKTIFAAPEVHIGFHPDAGASFFLSHLPGYLGEYLALTGDRFNGAEMTACGLATNYVHDATRIQLLEKRLEELITDDPSVIETALEEQSDIIFPDGSSVMHRIESIDKCFGHETVEGIIDALEREVGNTREAWCIRALRRLKEASPLSLKISLRSIREGRFQTFNECLVREYRMSLHAISQLVTRDFFEGIRAKMIDKDCSPKWNPPNLVNVSEDMVNQYFSPLGDLGDELELPLKEREAFV